MLTEAQLLAKLDNSEGQYLERKKSFHPEEVKEALVAFANTVPEGEKAVLFLGITPDGQRTGVEKADEIQRNITRLAEQKCFPAISCTPTVLRIDEVEIVAVVLGFGANRPHFVGHAFVRVGSETKKASPQVMDELIACRSDKARRIFSEKGQMITAIWKTEKKEIPPQYVGTLESMFFKIDTRRDCRIEGCDSFFLRLSEPSTSSLFSAAMAKVSLDWDNGLNRLKLVIDER
jgi:hypothetical protein